MRRARSIRKGGIALLENSRTHHLACIPAMKHSPTFSSFSELPPEIRLIIWRLCLPHCVHQLDNPCETLVFDLALRATRSPCKDWRTTQINGHPPLITRECRESRAVAFERGGFNVLGDIPPEAHWDSDNRAKGWLDPTRDSVHLNWEFCYVGDIGSVGNPVNCLVWNAKRVRGGGSLAFESLGGLEAVCWRHSNNYLVGRL